MLAFVGAVIAWILIALLTVAIGFCLQWLWFAQLGDAPSAYLWRWPILWVLCFFMAISASEHLIRLLTRHHDK